MSAESGPDLPVLVLADDLIWAERLVRSVRDAGATPRRVATLDRLTDGLPAARAAIVDLTSRAYDGIAAVKVAADAGCPVLAIGQHDDHDLRKAASAAGAARVLAYRKLADDGPATIRAFLASAPPRTSHVESPRA